MSILESERTAADIIAMLKEKWSPILGFEEKELLDRIKKLGGKIENDVIPMVSSFFKNLFSSKNITSVNEEFLTLPRLVEISKKYIVEYATEAAAYKQMKDETFFVYLAYCKDGELISQESNHYVIIKSEGLSKEVKDLFANSDLVVLN